MQIDVKKAKDRLPELIDEALSGSEVVIMRGRRPLVRLVDVHRPPRRPRQPGSARDFIEITDDFDEPLEDFREYT